MYIQIDLPKHSVILGLEPTSHLKLQHGTISSRGHEYSSRRGVENSKGPMRLDDSSTDICSPPKENGSIRGRHVRFTADTPVATLLQLATRPISRSNRCTGTGLERVSGVCQPPLVPVAEHSGQDQGARSPSASDSSSMEDPTMVSTCSGAVDRSPPTPTQKGECSNLTNREGVHHDSRSPQLAAWPLSGRGVDQKAFQRKLLDYSSHHGGAKQCQTMNRFSTNGVAGVMRGIEIPFEVL